MLLRLGGGAAMSDLSNAFVIGDETKVKTPKGVGRGLIQRDYSKYPRGYYASAMAIDFPITSMIEWPDRIKENEATKSNLSDIRNKGNNGQPIPSLDQNGQGYCWSYSTCACIQLLRSIANAPYVPLSAHSVACVIKNFRDEGGWGALSLDFAMIRGYQPQLLWPAKSMNRQYDTAANWEVAKQYRVAEGWIDLAAAVYDRDLSNLQVGTLLLAGIPVVCDYNWWGHSVCGMDLVDVYPNRAATDYSRYGIRILNSWTDGWGDNGTSVLKDSKAWPDGSVAPRATVIQ